MSPRMHLLLANAEALVSLAALVMAGILVGNVSAWWRTDAGRATSLMGTVLLATASGVLVQRRGRATKAQRAQRALFEPIEQAVGEVASAAKVWRRERAAGRALGGGAGALTRWRESEDELLAATDRLLAEEKRLVLRSLPKGGA